MSAAALASRTAAAPLLRSAWHLSTEHSLLMRVQGGDRLRVLHGTVWIAADGRGEETVLGAGGELVVARDAVLWMVGRDGPALEVLSRRPVSVGTRADYGRWRQQTTRAATARAPAARLIEALTDLWPARPARALAPRT